MNNYNFAAWMIAGGPEVARTPTETAISPTLRALKASRSRVAGPIVSRLRPRSRPFGRRLRLPNPPAAPPEPTTQRTGGRSR